MKSTDRTFFEGLYGRNSIEFVKGLVYVYPFGIIGKANNNNVKPHIHNNQFQIFLVIEGSTLLIHNNERIPVAAPSFITIPKNTEHGFEHQTEMKGWIISLSDVVLENMIKRETGIVIALETFQITEVTKDDFSEIVFKNLLECIEEYHKESIGKLLMLESMIGKIIVQLSRIPKSTQLRIFNKTNSSIIYFRRFSQLIRESCSYKKSIEQYASDLNSTSGQYNWNLQFYMIFEGVLLFYSFSNSSYELTPLKSPQGDNFINDVLCSMILKVFCFFDGEW